MTPTQFDPKHPDYEDDWDSRVACWESFQPQALPEALGNALAELLRLHEAFNQWMTPPAGSYHLTDHQQDCWGKASDLEALTCKALLEWHAGPGPMARAVKALQKCSAYYTACMKPVPLRKPA